MRQVQEDRKHMLDAVLGYLDTNTGVWQGIAKIGEVKNKLDEISLTIDTKAMVQEESRVSAGKIKLALKRTLADKADIVNDVVEVFAQMNGDAKLAEKMADSASDLYKMSYDAMQRRIKMIIDNAVKNKDELVGGYGLTEAQITGLQTDYDRMQELMGQPREYRINLGVATQDLEELFSESNNLLTNQLDNLMKVFKRRNASFYNGYLKARIVVNH